MVVNLVISCSIYHFQQNTCDMTGAWEMRCLLQTAYHLSMVFHIQLPSAPCRSYFLTAASFHVTLLIVRILAQHHQDFSVSWSQLRTAPHHHKQITSLKVESCSICRFCISFFRPNQRLPKRSYVYICNGVRWMWSTSFIHHNPLHSWQLSDYIEGDVVKESSHPTHVLIVHAPVSISMFVYLSQKPPFEGLIYQRSGWAHIWVQ